MKLYNTFTAGAMDKDTEVRLLQKGFYLDAKNIRIISPDGQNSRSVKFALGNTAMASVTYEGTGATCIGSCVDTFRNLIYFAVATSTHSYIMEYNVGANTIRTIVDDINSGGVFLFTTDMYVEMRVINDNDNGQNYLVLTDNTNEPKFFEIDTVQAITVDAYILEDVSLIKTAPLVAPVLTLGVTATGLENNIESKFLSFAYRYKYQNGEWSALSPFSEFAFMPDAFEYNYKEGTNDAMFNDFSKVDIALNVGTANVTDVQLILKESGSNTAFIVDTYNKAKEVWTTPSASETVTFDNSRIYKALDANQLSRVYDNVPTSAGTLEVIGNRLVFGNYTDGYDLTYSGTDINVDFTTSYTSAAGTAGVAHTQVKTNRDYELAIAYTDGKGRMTTPLVAPNNTTFVPFSVANQKVQLVATIDKSQRPPDWATQYRFFVKQSKNNYDVIAPITFYRDGVYAWVKLEGNDVLKVNEGDFLYVKSDTSGLKATSIRTKVLEITTQDENFLETTVPDPYEQLQQAGTYMRLQVQDYALSAAAVTTYEWIGYSFRSDGTANNIDGAVTYVEDPYYTGSDLNDLTQGGTLTGNSDIRFEIEIDGTGAPNTFKWRSWDVTLDDAAGAYTSLVSITGAAQTLSNGITITFGSTTGHTIGDKWFISCKSAGREDDWDKGGTVSSAGRHAIVLLQGKTALLNDEGIKAGANITITYDDSGSDTGNVDGAIGFVSYSLTSSKDYPNLEEWFYGDNIMSSITGLVWNDDINNVLFRRGSLDKTNGEEMTVSQYFLDPIRHRVYMAFLSVPNYTGSSSDNIRIDNSLIITEFDNSIIFETVPVDTTSDIFYELPYTYDITSGNHQGDTNQVFGVTDAVVTLDYFNSFGWYNGFESIKIGDTFNEKVMLLDTKPLIPIENYQSIRRISSLTYSDTYEATTQFNALNEFNLAEINYKDMDIKYGAIAKLHSRDTDLFVFQHDKTHRVLFSKSVLFNSDGTGNLTQSSNVLGQEVAFTGEYGICNNPESFGTFGNRIYHLDKDRGALMRLSADGYTEVSQNGMRDYFRTLTSQTTYVGGYDPYNDEYLINVVPDASPLTLAFQEQVGFTSFYEFEPERLIGINNRLYSIKDGDIWLHDDNATRKNFYGVQRDASINTVFNDQPQDVKHFRSVNTESSNAWDIPFMQTNFGFTSLTAEEFSEEEEEYYAYVRQNEQSGIDAQGFGGSIGGIGEVSVIASLVVTLDVTELPRALAIGDSIWKDDGDDTITIIGTVTAVNRTAKTITLDSVAGLSVSNFIMFEKVERIEGGAMKGYYLQLNMTNDSTTDQELFAVKVEASRSSD